MVRWLSGLSVAILLTRLLGVKFVGRNRRPPSTAGSLSDLGEGFALVHTLRVEITRLREDNERLLADREEILKVLSRVSDTLEREAVRLSARSEHFL